MRRSGLTAKEIVSSAPMHQLVIGFLYAGNGLLHSRQWHPFFIQRHTIKLYITLFGCQILSFGFGRFFHFSQLVGCLGVGFSGKGTAFEQPLPSEIGYGFTFIHITEYTLFAEDVKDYHNLRKTECPKYYEQGNSPKEQLVRNNDPQTFFGKELLGNEV